VRRQDVRNLDGAGEQAVEWCEHAVEVDDAHGAGGDGRGGRRAQPPPAVRCQQAADDPGVVERGSQGVEGGVLRPGVRLPHLDVVPAAGQGRRQVGDHDQHALVGVAGERRDLGDAQRLGHRDGESVSRGGPQPV
jgi:hypothetical protein